MIDSDMQPLHDEAERRALADFQALARRRVAEACAWWCAVGALIGWTAGWAVFS